MPPKQSRKEQQREADENARLAIVSEKCKPKNCNLEVYCPVNRSGKECVSVTKQQKRASISEITCIGCGICVKRCPFDAINIIRIPRSLDSQVSHRFGPNQFKLHRLPVPKLNSVLGLVGQNGIGKSTALNILSGEYLPNLGRYKVGEQPSQTDIIANYRGSELQAYFVNLFEEKITSIYKIQYVEKLAASSASATVAQVFKNLANSGAPVETIKELLTTLELNHLLKRKLAELSGGELQRFAIAVAVARPGNLYLIDEPTSYLDVKQRLTAARVIRKLADNTNNYVITVEHDLAILDYLSDYCHVLYGVPGVYGVISQPVNVRDGINNFLSGHIPTENLVFREEPIIFRSSEAVSESMMEGQTRKTHRYPAMSKSFDGFKLNVEAGSFNTSEIIVLLGENGTGKTTFIKLLAGMIQPDNAEEMAQVIESLSVSYKPQKISPKFKGTVLELLQSKVGKALSHAQFQADVAKPLDIDVTGTDAKMGFHNIAQQLVPNLSGGEMQRVALCLALGKPADIYLIDEPSAYLDAEQRVIAARVIKKYIMHVSKSAFVVEHDFLMACYIADKVVVYTGTPGVEATATKPRGLHAGMNLFLAGIGVTYRRDPTNFRPRVNKLNSIKDCEQKAAGNYFFSSDV